MAGSRKGRSATPDEQALWRLVTRDVKPIGPQAEEPEDEPPAEEGAAADPPVRPQEPRPKEPPPPPALRHPPHLLHHGHSAGVDRRTAERFTKGRMEIDGRLDLHGHTQEAAHAALRAFLARSQEAGKRCVIVITGKGYRDGTGVLKSQVPRWLNEKGLRERVLSFSYAQPQHGGEGALYVLLKRIR